MSSDRDSLSFVPTRSATPITVFDPFLINAIRPRTAVSRERISHVFFPATIMLTQADGSVQQYTRTFTTMTADLLALNDWLSSHNVGMIALESTGVFWRPVFNVLEEGRQEGELRKSRVNVLDVLEARFGAAAASEIRPAVNALTDGEHLDHLLRIAATCPRLEEFKRDLAPFLRHKSNHAIAAAAVRYSSTRS